MLADLKHFDPIRFLNIDTKTLTNLEVDKLRDDLNAKIGEYLLLRFADDLTEEQLKSVTKQSDPTLMLDILGDAIPDLHNRILREIEGFKSEYLKALDKE